MPVRAPRFLLPLLAVFVLASAAEARTKPRPKRPASTVGLGHRCKKKSDCHNKAQVCIHESDASGKELAFGFCALPCLTMDAGLAKVVPGKDPTPEELAKKRNPARCPSGFKCRTGPDAPMDLCVKE